MPDGTSEGFPGVIPGGIPFKMFEGILNGISWETSGKMFEESLTNILRKSLLELLNKYLAEIIQMQCIALAELLDESLKKTQMEFKSSNLRKF